MGAAFRAREFRRSASLFWDCAGFETDNLARQSAGMRRAATLPHGSAKHERRNDDAAIEEDDHRSAAFWRNEPEDSVWRNEPKRRAATFSLFNGPVMPREGGASSNHGRAIEGYNGDYWIARFRGR